MAYLKIYRSWLPYSLMNDRRGFISRQFGGSHSGVDSVGNQYANPVCAVADGVVTEVSVSPTLGNCVFYEQGNARIAHYHLAAVSVPVGAKVVAGVTRVGVEGATGSLATGKHLHTSLWLNGVLTDPEPYLSGQRVLNVEAAGGTAPGTENGGETGVRAMVRQVIRNDLNLRNGPGVGYTSFGFIPLGGLMNVQSTVPVGSAVWGRVTVVLADGRTYTGYSNLGSTWSREYTGAVRPV